MRSDERRLRHLTLPDGTAYRWSVRHRRLTGDRHREVLTLHRDGAAVRVVFDEGPGRVAGTGFHFHTGLVSDEHGNWVNLHEPAVVRAFVDEIRRRGDTVGEVDGWELLPAVAVSRAAAAPARRSGR
ncbi:hypothetical protein ACIPPM_10600 [Streptomyces sp. NPDC090119]|uniref:hypothetical protein n=1 Tax=Streptomyces sp. NPDC090119 TaxID=3365951 RepID=UPI0037FBE37C